MLPVSGAPPQRVQGGGEPLLPVSGAPPPDVQVEEAEEKNGMKVNVVSNTVNCAPICNKLPEEVQRDLQNALGSSASSKKAMKTLSRRMPS